MGEHWAARWIGRPYARGGRGPEAVDCWGLCLAVWRERYGVELPDLWPAATGGLIAHRLLRIRPGVAARRLAGPVEGCAVIMARARIADHIGVWIAPSDGGGVLHAVEPVGVVFSRPGALAGAGLRIVDYLTTDGLPCPTSTS